MGLANDFGQWGERERERATSRVSDWAPQGRLLTCDWLTGRGHLHKCRISFLFFLINGTEMVDPSLLNQSQSLSMICYRDTGRCALSWFRPSDWSLSRFCLTPQWTELLHNKSLSHTFNLRILENSAILFSIYINNSKFVLFKFALGLHTCVYIYSVCNVYTCQHVCSKMFDVKVGTPTGFSCLFLFLKLDNI